MVEQISFACIYFICLFFSSRAATQIIIDASETKNYLVDAFVTADIPLEKIDKLQHFKWFD